MPSWRSSIWGRSGFSARCRRRRAGYDPGDLLRIAEFRRDHPEALNGVCREFIVLCRRLDLFGGELLAIDGSKFRAVNARDQCYTPARLATLQRDIDRTIVRYLRE